MNIGGPKQQNNGPIAQAEAGSLTLSGKRVKANSVDWKKPDATSAQFTKEFMALCQMAVSVDPELMKTSPAYDAEPIARAVKAVEENLAENRELLTAGQNLGERVIQSYEDESGVQKDLQEQLRLLQEELKNLEEVNRLQQENVDSLSDQLKGLQEKKQLEANGLKDRQIEDLTQKNAQLEKQLGETAKLKEIVAQLTGSVIGENMSKEDLNALLLLEDRKVTDLRQEMDGLRMAAAMEKEEFDAQIKQANEQIRKAQDEKAELEKRLRSARADRDDFSERVEEFSKYKRMYNELQGEMQKLQLEFNQLEFNQLQVEQPKKGQGCQVAKRVLFMVCCLVLVASLYVNYPSVLAHLRRQGF